MERVIRKTGNDHRYNNNTEAVFINAIHFLEKGSGGLVFEGIKNNIGYAPKIPFALLILGCNDGTMFAQAEEITDENTNDIMTLVYGDKFIIETAHDQNEDVVTPCTNDVCEGV